MADTIFALSSGSVPSAVAVVRISGPGVPRVIEQMCRGDVPRRVASYRPILDPVSGERIDSGIVIYFPGPHSFTGEDCLELQVHGSRAVLALLFKSLGRMREMRPAVPGEFVRRAFENGKLPLTSVEGLADLIDARTEAQRKQALQQAGGRLADRAETWRKELLEARGLLEAEIDFADEGEAPSGVLSEVRSICDRLLRDWKRAVSDASRGETIRSGYRIVIAGAPNAGKSSLLNAVVRREAAIVTEHSGTTRDVIEVELDLDGFPIVLCDTAGLRETSDPIEAIGIGKAVDAADEASLVVVLGDAREKKPQFEFSHARVLTVASKMDLVATVPDWAELGISINRPETLERFVMSLTEIASKSLAGEAPLLTHHRQRYALDCAILHLQASMAEDELALELVAEDLRVCGSILAGMTGSLTSDDVLGEVFSRFCMGK